MNHQAEVSPFYSEAEVDELTGIKKGASGHNKYALQCNFLRSIGLPFIKNARGRPVVARSAVEGQRQKADTANTTANKGWQPKLISA